MRAPVITVRAAAKDVIGAEAVLLAVVAALPLAGLRPGWPVLVGLTAVLAALISVHVHGHTLPARALMWLHTRRHPDLAAHIPDPIDIRRGEMVIGVQRDDTTATTVVRLAGRPYSPTVLPGHRRAVTPNTVPLAVIADQLTQPGPLVMAGIDIVSAGSRVAGASGYAPVYSAVLTDQSAAGQRDSYAILRVDLAASTHGLALRDSVEDAAAATAERLICALRQHNCRATALSANEVRDLIGELAGPQLQAVSKTRRDRLDNESSHWASYFYSPDDITTANLDDIWAWQIDGAVSTVTVAPAPAGVAVTALVRTHTSIPAALAPTAYLNSLPGQQSVAAASCVPGGPRLAGLPHLVLTDPAGLRIPIGAAGVLVGAIHADGQRRPVLLPLSDPSQRTRIRMNTSDVYLRQLLIRAAATGSPVSVYTDDPDRWSGLNDPLIDIHAAANEPSATPPAIVVKDRADGKPQSAASTIVSLPADSSYPAGLAPDIDINEPTPGEIEVTTAAFSTTVTALSIPDERPYLGVSGRHRI